MRTLCESLDSAGKSGSSPIAQIALRMQKIRRKTGCFACDEKLCNSMTVADFRPQARARNSLPTALSTAAVDFRHAAFFELPAPDA